MNWKTAIYSIILFCTAILMQSSDTHTTVNEPNKASYTTIEQLVINTETIVADEDYDKNYQIHDKIIAPTSSNALAGRQNNSKTSARILSSKKLQTKHACLADRIDNIAYTNLNNVITFSTVSNPTGIHANTAQFISINRFNC